MEILMDGVGDRLHFVLTSLVNFPGPVARDFHDPKCKVDLRSSMPRCDGCRKKFSPRPLLVKSLTGRTNFDWYNGLSVLLFVFFLLVFYYKVNIILDAMTQSSPTYEFWSWNAIPIAVAKSPIFTVTGGHHETCAANEDTKVLPCSDSIEIKYNDTWFILFWEVFVLFDYNLLYRLTGLCACPITILRIVDRFSTEFLRRDPTDHVCLHPKWKSSNLPTEYIILY